MDAMLTALDWTFLLCQTCKFLQVLPWSGSPLTADMDQYSKPLGEDPDMHILSLRVLPNALLQNRLQKVLLPKSYAPWLTGSGTTCQRM